MSGGFYQRPRGGRLLGSEDDFQETVVNYLRLKYRIEPRVGMEAGRRSFHEIAKAKRLGLAPGWPDVEIHEARGPWFGCAAELKSEEGYRKQSKAKREQQLARLEYLRDRGWRVAMLKPTDPWSEWFDFYFLGALRRAGE